MPPCCFKTWRSFKTWYVRHHAAIAHSRPRMTRAPCPQVPECPVFGHAIFSHPAWAQFKLRVLEHVAEQANALTQNAVVARADTEAIGAIGACLTALCGQVGALTTLFGSLPRTADDMKAEVAEVVREAMREAMRNALLAAYGAVGGATPGGAAYPNSARPERAQSPPRPPAQQDLRAPPASKAWLDLGKIADVRRMYDEWHFGDKQTGGAALKDMKARCPHCVRCTHADRRH